MGAFSVKYSLTASSSSFTEGSACDRCGRFILPLPGGGCTASLGRSHRTDKSARRAGPRNAPNTPPLRLRSAQDQAVDAAAHRPKVGLVPALQLRNGAPRIANFAKARAP